MYYMVYFIRKIKSYFFSIFFLFSLTVFADTPSTSAKNAIVVDLTNSYSVLYEKNADALIPPASMSKIMTAYVIFDLLKKKELRMSQVVRVPQEAFDIGGAHTGSSSMRLKSGQSVSIEQLLHGLLTASGNDAAITLAVAASGSESKFAELMTLKAKELGISGYFANASGLPNPGQKMSVRDLAILAHRIIIDFPEYFPLFSEKEFTFNGVTHRNRNWLLQNRSDIDGLKTGHTVEAGYCITITGKRNGRRLIVVVAGTDSAQERIDESSKLMDWGYENFEWNWFFAQGQELLKIPVWAGQEKEIGLKVQNNVRLFLSQERALNLTSFITYISPVKAPIYQGQPLGKVIIKDKKSSKIIASTSLLAGSDIEALTGIKRLAFNWKTWRGRREHVK